MVTQEELEYKIKAYKLLLEKKVPEKYWDNIKALAYEYGHAFGYHEVYNYLLDIVGIFDINKIK